MPAQPHPQGQLNRYPGVKPFTADERKLFFGREEDIDKLYSLLFIKQSVVLYGKSGYGKSSLLNAGIIPKLREEGEWKYFSIRFNNFSGREGTENVSPIENVKLHIKKDIDVKAAAELDTVIPQENSFWYWIKAHQKANKKAQFIFFFDQFEELFTYPQKEIEEFSEQLSQLLYNTVPLKFRKRLSEMDELGEISDSLHQYIYEKPIIKIVFSIRSDRLSLLNTLTDRHPNILQNMYELDALSKLQAEQAIINPAKAQYDVFSSPPFDFADGAVQKILNSIANTQDGKFETATLQIICRYVEEELVVRKQIKVITSDFLGEIADIFKIYYEGVIARLDVADKDKVKHVIEDELIEAGRRNTLTELHIKKKFGFDEKLLLQLEQSSLLRKERDPAGRILYEISHDTLVDAIEKVAQERREVEKNAKQKALEDTLIEERKRAELLSNLNDKAKVRTRIAIGLAIVSLIIAAFAFYFWYDSQIAAKSAILAQQTAEAQRKKALEEENIAKVALFKNNMQQAKYLIEDVKNSYLLSRDYDLGLKNLSVADSLLLIDITLPAKEESERKDLLITIDENRDSCYKLKNNPS